VAVASADQDNDLWVLDLARQTLSQRTFGPATEFFPVWSRDGRSLLFATDNGRGAALTVLAADGTGKAETLSDASGAIPTDVTPDGRYLLFTPSGRDVMMLPLDPSGWPLRAAPGATVQRLIQTAFNERNGTVSPDGQWLAYESDSSGRFEIYVRPFPDTTTGQSLASSGGGARPVWSKNGRAIFYEGPGGAIMEVTVTASGKAWRAGAPIQLFQGPYASLAGSNRNFDVSGNGERFLMVKRRSESEGPQIVVVQNWFAELRRLAPPTP
jgi:serine/threonine-protein kinase